MPNLKVIVKDCLVGQSFSLESLLWLQALIFSFLVLSCSTSEPEVSNEPIPDKVNVPPKNEDSNYFEGKEYQGEYGTVEILNSELIDNNFILVNDAGNNRVYLMDKKAQVRHEWPLSNNLGNDALLVPKGRLLVSLEADDTQIEFGGQGGKLQFMDKGGRILWNFDYSSENFQTHHDAILLPNGNVVALVWEKMTKEESVFAGSKLNVDLYPEAIIEINPTTDEIVWEWHAWNHLVQDYDADQMNYGVIAENPQLIDLNYAPKENGDIMHANGIGYDAINDLIFVSVNFYHEIWVIDHSTTTQEAADHSGGNRNQGGDLVYRFGNPMAYKNTSGERLFHNNHHPNVLTAEDQGNLLVFSNGNGLDPEQSTVFELKLPEPLGLFPDTDNEPTIVWSFTDKNLFSAKVSGAVKLPNGNRLITEGDYGLWEVTEDGEVIWKYSGDGFFWRAYNFNKDSPEIRALGL